MRTKWLAVLLTAAVAATSAASQGRGGDSLVGTVTAVRRPDLVVLDYGTGQYNVRLIGIVVPADSLQTRQARQLVSSLVLNRRARMRFEFRRGGEMWSRLLTADSVVGLNRDVGLELVRAGLARKQQDYDYKYGELSAAEAEARRERRGLWAASPER